LTVDIISQRQASDRSVSHLGSVIEIALPFVKPKLKPIIIDEKSLHAVTQKRVLHRRQQKQQFRDEEAAKLTHQEERLYNKYEEKLTPSVSA
jgi:hypothetical protein